MSCTAVVAAWVQMVTMAPAPVANQSTGVCAQPPATIGLGDEERELAATVAAALAQLSFTVTWVKPGEKCVEPRWMQLEVSRFGTALELRVDVLDEVTATQQRHAQTLETAVGELPPPAVLAEALRPAFGALTFITPPAQPESSFARRAVPLALLATGTVAAGVSVWLGLDAAGHSSNANDPYYVGGQLEAERARTSRTRALLAGGVALGSIAAGAVLWLLDAE